MRIDILTLFPEMCRNVLDMSIIGAALDKGVCEIYCHNIRDYTTDKHRRADDYPYGGGQGMLLCAEPCARCFEAVWKNIGKRPFLIHLSPRGKVFTQGTAKELSELENIALLCGHYEGIDQRVIDEYVDMEISLGDYVLTGGELAALAVTDAVVRLLPGALSEESSYSDESHYNGLLEYPQYTRPYEWRGRKVPDVLLSGDQKRVERWKRENAIKATALYRPDMLANAPLSEDEKRIAELSGVPE